MDTKMKSKAAKVADEFARQSPKNPVGLSFQPTETDTMFIFTAHLKGCTQGNVKVDPNEDGTKLEVKCKKSVQQTVTVGNNVIKKDVVNINFTDSLKIPDGVIVDRIENNFNEETSILTIKMPKRIKEPELATQTSSENLPSTATRATFQEDKGAADSESAYPKGQVEIHGAKDEVPGKETKIANDKLECTNLKDEQKDDKVCEKENGIQKEEDKVPKRSKICVPVIVGSTIFLSLVVFVIHFMRKKKQPGKRKE
ncbi:uncharacterized protein LOC129879938 [Solanum dulcamara]|uniref:uncharacterized protein LOC129879938 n=1 Tax=Solanum dulcamara TaxID=45834 RepID=UPI002484EA14|nr:uncharacterized protein LOC129879938 [Solanum dulcamara]